MDRRADAGCSTVTPVVRETRGFDQVICEQAVYTCICTPAGQGYRVIAASSGFSSHDCAEIVRFVPALGGLCADTPDATGISFSPISNQRFAVLHTCHAGKEPTGRGGRRAYTRILVIDAAGFRRFRNNPFAVVRAACTAGSLVVDLAADVVLPQLALSPKWGMPSTGFDAVIGTVSSRWIACITDQLLSGGSVAVSAGGELQAIAELVVLSIPAPLRSEMSFSSGVTFAVSRPHRLVIVSNITPQTRDRIAGTEYTFVDSAADPANARSPAHPWARTVGRFIETRRTNALIGMLADRFSEGDLGALRRIGELCLALDSAASSEIENLIDVAMPYVGLSPELPLERELARQVVRLVRHRFSSLISHADGLNLSNVWRRMLSAKPQSPEAARLVEESAALAVTRMSCLDPIEAMRLILETDQGGKMNQAASDLEYARQTVVTCVVAWVAQAATEDLEAAVSVLATWCGRYPDDQAAAECLGNIRTRLAESAPPVENSEPAVACAGSE